MILSPYPANEKVDNTHCDKCGRELTEDNRYIKTREDGTIYVYPTGPCCSKLKRARKVKTQLRELNAQMEARFQSFLCQSWR